MNDLITLVIILGITFTSIGTVGSIIIMCILLIINDVSNREDNKRASKAEAK